MGDTAKPCGRNLRPLYGVQTSGTSGQCREQRAAGIDAMVYIYRLKYPFFPPVRHFSFYLILSSPRIRFSFQSNHAFLPGLAMEGNGKSEPSVWSRDRDIFPDFPLFVEAPSVQLIGTKKEARPSVHPSARGFPCDCIRQIAIYGCRYCAAGYPLDIEGSERSSRENCSLRSGKPRVSGLPSSFAFESLR